MLREHFYTQCPLLNAQWATAAEPAADQGLGSFTIVEFLSLANGSQEIIENHVSHFPA